MTNEPQISSAGLESRPSETTAAGAATVSQAAPPAALAAEPHQRFARARKVARLVLATEAWKRELRGLRKRFSFPLARKVISNELRSNQSVVMLDKIPDGLLLKTCIGHVILMAAMSAALIWSLILAAKGLTAALKFGVVLNTWLIPALPLLVFSGLRLRLSLKTYRAVAEEISRRKRHSLAETPKNQ